MRARRKIVKVIISSLLSSVAITACVASGYALLSSTFKLFFEPSIGLLVDIAAYAVACIAAGFIATLTIAFTILEMIDLFESIEPFAKPHEDFFTIFSVAVK